MLIKPSVFAHICIEVKYIFSYNLLYIMRRHLGIYVLYIKSIKYYFVFSIIILYLAHSCKRSVRGSGHVSRHVHLSCW